LCSERREEDLETGLLQGAPGCADGPAKTEEKTVMSYLVTGGTGFIGAYITKLLIHDGKDVVAFDVEPRPEVLESLIGKERKGSLKMIIGDITDLPHLIRTVQEFGVTKIFHMAALLSRASSANPSLAVRINCEGTANIFETARILGLQKVVYASSNTVFGPIEKYRGEVIGNDAPHYPVTIYGACKSFNEKYAEYYFGEYGVDSAGLRFPVVYGLGHKPGSASSILSQELIVNPAMGKPGRVPYYGEEILNWIYVEDAARGAVMVGESERTKTKAFNIGGEVCTVAGAAEYVKKKIPGADLTFLPNRIEFTGKFDTSNIKDEVGYTPRWSLEKGIELMIDKVRSLNG
jgi:UDP-glucose 4-epimerase